MEDQQQRDESQVEVPQLPGDNKDTRSCWDCRHLRRNGFGYCRYFDKPTSGQVNGCFGFKVRKK